MYLNVHIYNDDVGVLLSFLFLVKVRTFRPDNARLIAIYSKVLPNDVRVQRSRLVKTLYFYTIEFNRYYEYLPNLGENSTHKIKTNCSFKKITI